MAAPVITAVGTVLLQALINAITQTLTNLFTSAISGGLNRVADALSGLSGAWGWVGSFVGDVLRNVGGELTKIVNRGLGTVATSLEKTIGVYRAQERAFAAMENWAGKLTDNMISFLGWKQEDNRAKADVILRNAITTQATSAEIQLASAGSFFGNLVDRAKGWFGWAWDQAKDRTGSFFNGVIKGIKDGTGLVGSIFKGIRDRVAKAVKGATDFAATIIAGFSSAMLDFATVLFAGLEDMLTIEPTDVIKTASGFIDMMLKSVQEKVAGRAAVG